MKRRDFCLSTAAVAALPALPLRAFAASSQDARLAAALDEFYRTALDESPETATALGVDTGARAADKAALSSLSIEAVERRKQITNAQIATLNAIDRSALSPAAVIDLDCVLYDRTATQRSNRRFAYGGEGAGAPYVLSQITGAYMQVPDFLASQHTIADRQDCEAYLSRLDAFARQMGEEAERVTRDAGLGVVPPDFSITGALAQMKLMRVPADQSSLVTSLATRAADKHIPGDWTARAGAIHEKHVLPALDRQIALLQSLQAKATHDAGVWRLPDGDAYYAEALRTGITSDMPPAQVHQLGLDITRQLSARAEVLFRQLGLTQGSIADRFGVLFQDKRYLYPNTDAGRAQEIAALNDLVGAMQKRLPAWFGTLPRAPLEIRRIPPETEGGMSTHYTQASLDGSRPGIYWLNLRDTAEAPFWDMPTTTFHEGVPGHHLQITLQNQASLPEIRKIIGFNAYIEGWALYAEQLAQEMGFFKDQPAWELGYIHDALLRSGRLVVDTGIHAMRWTREQAVATLHEIDGDPLGLCGQEIERYACWPGQACGYMVGKVTILRLRDKAKQALGQRFDICGFHDALLLSGSMPLAVLEHRIDAWIVEQRAG